MQRRVIKQETAQTSSAVMGLKERVGHAILFELIALGLMIPLTAIITGRGAGELALVGVALSLYTVVWNFCYNLMFDTWCSVPRLQRNLALRLAHVAGFEGGLIFVTVPSVAWYLDISLLHALALEAGFLLFFFAYALLFNWAYDSIRSHYWGKLS